MSFNKCHSFCTSSRIIPENTTHNRCVYCCTRFLNAPHSHAKMPGLDNNEYAFGTQCLHDRLCYVCGQSFLNLQALCLYFNNPCQFTNPCYSISLRNIGYMCDGTFQILIPLSLHVNLFQCLQISLHTYRQLFPVSL